MGYIRKSVTALFRQGMLARMSTCVEYICIGYDVTYHYQLNIFIKLR